jgi:hypothetical protein
VVDGSSIAFLEHQIRALEAIATAALAAGQFTAATAARDKITPLRHELEQHRRMEAERERQAEVIAALGADPAWVTDEGTPGRPTKLTPELAAELFRLLRQGMNNTQAAARVGIDVRTLQLWLAQGRKAEDGRFFHFSRGVMAARAEGQDRITRTINELLDPEYERDSGRRLRAAEIALRYLHADEFSPRTRVEATGKDGGPIEVKADATVRPIFTDAQLAAMSPEQLAAALEALGAPPAG